MEAGNVNILIVAFVALIIGVSLLAVVASSTTDVSETINIRNETIDITDFRNDTVDMDQPNCNVSITPVAVTQAPDGWRTSSEYGCWIADFVMVTANHTPLTNATDYVFYPNNGTWRCLPSATFNQTSTTNNTAVNYTYCPDEYLTAGWSRTMVNLVPGFFALALLGISIGLFYLVAKREGLINV